ncbi:MAG: hypothetical protein WD063_08835 [Pirellulales bacterium]
MKVKSEHNPTVEHEIKRQTGKHRFEGSVISTSVLVIISALAGCTKQDSRLTPTAERAAEGVGQVDAGLQAKAERVTEGVGELITTTPSRAAGPVFIFEENHASRIGQIQIATMLTRLYHQQGLRIVGLEGAIKATAPLPAGKYLAAVDESARNATLKDLLREAEISGAEYAGAVLPGLQIVGIENADEYNVRPPDGVSPEFVAILAIAERTLNPEALQNVAEKISRGKVDDAIDAMKSADPWIKARLDTMMHPSQNLADLVGNVQAIKEKAQSLEIELPLEVASGLDASISFHRTADDRSSTMADAIAELSKQNPGKPVAMIIGAAHTERVLAELESNGVAAVVLRAKSFKGEDEEVGRFVLKSQGLWGNDEIGSLGAILNPKKDPSEGERKPAPVIGDMKRDGYASAQAAAKIAAKAVRGGGEFPKSVVNQLQALPGITVHPDSFEKQGYDVIFAFDIEDTTGKKQRVWVRAGTKPVAAKSANDPVETALLKLEQAEAEAGEGGGKEPPKVKKTTGTEEPGEGGKPNQGKVESEAGNRPRIGSLTNREVQAKFFRSAEEARSSPPISI